jgi:hypothetical protein
MPELPNNVPRYEPNQPYYYTFDNTPIDSLIQRDDIINSQVDLNTEILKQAGGEVGTLPAFLAQFASPTGALLPLAINTALHNIGYHTDGTGPDSLEYVRMLQSERDKLSTVSENATSFGLKVQLPSTTSTFTEDFVTFAPSNTVTWSVENGQIVKANVVAQPTGHTHYDNVQPTNPSFDYQTYFTGLSTAFMSGSLCVYINGVRIFDGGRTVNVPGPNPLVGWNPNSFTASVGSLGFTLATPITSSDVIVIDFIVSDTA